MYVILSRNGYTFASQGMDYVVLKGDEVVFKDMNKVVVEREFMRLVKGA
jgi:hypothetical protein